MLVAWSGLELLRYGLYRSFGFSFEIAEVFDTTIADLTYMHLKEPDLWPITYAGYSWGLSWYYAIALCLVAICYIYLLILVIFRHSTHESPPNTSWWSLYADLWPIEINCVFLVGVTRSLSLMIIHGASFQVFGGTSQNATKGHSATWAHLTSHYYLAVFVIITNVWMNVGAYAYSKYEDYVRGVCFDESTPLDGKVYIVTGSNTGIGYQTAAELTYMGATVVMACRTPEKANAAREQILRGRQADWTSVGKTEPIAPSKVMVLPLDLNSFKSVRAFVAAFKNLQLPLHGLINNAGLMTAERYETSPGSGLEAVMTANHLAHFLLTNLLMPELNATAHRELAALRLRKGGGGSGGDVQDVQDVQDAEQQDKSKSKSKGKGKGKGKGKTVAFAETTEAEAEPTGLTQEDIDSCYGRVVTLASALHRSTTAFNFDDIMSEKNYSLFGTYAQSKLANVLFTCELQDRIDVQSAGKEIDHQILVVANSVHPGCVRTEVTRNMSKLIQLGNDLSAPLMCWLQKTPREGCFSSVFAAISPEAVAADEDGLRGGAYYFHCQKADMGAGVNATDAKRLWKVSEAYVEEKFM